jgi:hypothetical protein
MQRVSDILNSTYKGFSKIIKIRELWPEIAGEVLSSHTEPVQLKGKTLWVLCDSSAWVQQVDILSPTLVPRVHKITGIKVDKLAAKFSAKRGREIPKPESIREARKRLRKPDIDPADVEKITNPELKKAVKALLEG